MKSRIAARLASWLVAAYLRLLDATSSKTIVDRARFDDALAEGRGVILAFWHSRLIMTPFLRRYHERDAYMLISRHRDGDIIADGVKGFGVKFIRGSAANPLKPGKAKHGAPAVAEMLEALNRGDIVAVTPDGPRGPANRAQAGIIRLAQKAGAPIVPGGVSASRGRKLNTWDRFLLAAPFSRIYYVAGSALVVPADADEATIEALKDALTEEISRVTTAADHLAGRDHEHND